MLYDIAEASKILGVHQTTLRRWERDGLIKPIRTDGGHRRYTDDELNRVLLKQNKKTVDRFVVGYCRVSSSGQKDDLNRQIETVSSYCAAKGYQFKIIKDIGSGLNYTKPGLNELVTLICTGQVSKVVLNYKDRLVRNGFELIEQMCRVNDVEIEIINLTENTNEAELVEDVLAIITVYSAKLYGSRSHKNKKIVDTNKEMFTTDN